MRMSWWNNIFAQYLTDDPHVNFHNKPRSPLKSSKKLPRGEKPDSNLINQKVTVVMK